MNKKELYRSIEGIRQDRHLKERIIRATEEKDEITVIKRRFYTGSDSFADSFQYRRCR